MVVAIAEGTSFKYSVFISYSRKDIDFARKLETALEAYHPPKHLPVPHRRLNVFRDESDFTGSDYLASLDNNLRDSSKLLVICSPRSRASSYVNQEIERFAQYRGAQNILSVLVAGLPNNEAKPEQEEDKAFPDALLRFLPTPLAAEYRGFDAQRDQPNRGTFVNAWYKTLADIYVDYRVDRDQIAEVEVRRRARRMTAIVSGVAAVVIVLSALTGWALVERHEAVRQRAEAEQKQRRLEEAINGITFNFPDELRKLEPGLAVLETTYRGNFELLKKLYDNNVTGPMLDLPMAANVLNLAGIWVRQGKLEDAARYLAMIPDHRKHMTEKEWNDPTWQDNLSLAHDQIAEVSTAQGDLKDAQEHYQAALAIRTVWAAQRPNEARWQGLLAASHQNLCKLELDRGNTRAAREHCMAALATSELAAKLDKENMEWRQQVAWSRMFLTDVAEEQGHLPEALEQLHAARLIIDRGKASSDWRLPLLAMQERTGTILLAMQDYAGAKTEIDAAFALGEQLARDNADAEGRKNFAILRHDIADFYKSSGKFTDAVRHFDAACTGFDELGRKDDANQELQRLLAECLGNLGAVRLPTGDHLGALQDLQRSLAIREALAKERADQPLLQRDLATGYQQLGDWYALKGNHTWAITKYRSALDIRARLAREDESHGKLQEELAATHAKIGSVRVASEDFTAAIASYREAIAIQEHLRAQDPTNARWQKDLAVTYETASNLLRSTGDADGAAAYRAKANRLKSG